MKATKETVEKIEKAIAIVRPFIQQDGGDVSFVSYENGVVLVTLMGACEGCPLSSVTIKMGLEKEIKKHVPEIKEVVAI